MSSRRRPVTRRVREFRQSEAAKRQAEYDKLTLQQKLDRLPAPPAAARQRAKLMGQTQKPVTKSVTPNGTFATGANPPEGWAGLVGKTVEEIDTHFAQKETPRPVDSEGRFVKYGDEGSKPLKAKERRAQEKK